MIHYSRAYTNRAFFFMTIILFAFSSVAVAGDGSGIYWVSTTGTASWSICESSTPLDGTSACSLVTANTNASAGETINIRGGTYNTTGIAPTNSGTSGNRITWQAYNSEHVEITGLAYGINLNGDDYHRIIGITVSSCDVLMRITAGSDHNEIDSCTMHTDTSALNDAIQIYTNGATAGTANTHNWIHDNTFYNGGQVSASCSDSGGLITVGTDAAFQDDLSGNNTLEDNHFYHGAHHVLKTKTKYNVIRNNFIHNEDSFNASAACKAVQCTDTGSYGNRCLNSLDDQGAADTYNLIEGNRLGNAGIPSDGNGGYALVIGAGRSIARFNTIFSSQEMGLYFRSSGNVADYNKVYNNTIYANGQNKCRNNPGTARHGIHVQNGANYNSLVNNISYNNVGNDINIGGSVVGLDNRNNWTTATGNPQFVNTTLSDPASTTEPDLSPQSGSGVIDNGTYLTQANGSGSTSTNLIVDDALYFQYGERGSSLSNIQADWIAIGTVVNVVQISSINYSTNTITLASPMTWNDNAPVWLYKDSRGTRVLYGSAPDQGAYGYPIILPPQYLRIIP